MWEKIFQNTRKIVVEIFLSNLNKKSMLQKRITHSLMLVGGVLFWWSIFRLLANIF